MRSYEDTMTPRHSDEKTKLRSIRFPLSKLQKIEQLAKEQDRSFNWMVNQLVQEALDRREAGKEDGDE